MIAKERILTLAGIVLAALILCLSCRSAALTAGAAPDEQIASVSTGPVSEDLPLLACEQSREIDSLTGAVTIRTNTPKASIFLNGEFQGKSELTVRGLSEGRYHLSAGKKGFEAADFFIDVVRGRHDTFYLTLAEMPKSSLLKDEQ